MRRLGAGLVLLLGLGCGAPAAPPNLVLIVLDDLGSGDLGATGSSLGASPNIDRLAAEGLLFSQYYANGPVCTPSRAGLLTGRHPSELGLRSALYNSRRGLPQDVPTLPRVLARAGYATGHFGKWHLGRGRLPEAVGFERVVEGSAPYRNPALRPGERARQRVPGHLTELLTDEVLAFIEEHRGQPFFANVWYSAPHRPWDLPDRLALPGATPTARYAAMIWLVDEQIGRIVAKLRELSLEQRTLVLVTSDNGGSAKPIATNGALRGFKGALFEGGIRAPLVAWWPGTAPAGRTLADLALGSDLLLTFAELARVELGDPAAEGRSLAPLLRGENLPPREEPLFWESRPPGHEPDGSLDWAVRRGSWKLVRHAREAGGRPQLFDLSRDPSETRDLAAAEPDRAEGLARAYWDWRARSARLPGEIDRLEGAVTRGGDALHFRGGAAVLAPDQRFVVHDGDLGFRVDVVPESLGGEQTVAEHPGSWSLSIGSDGRPRLALSEAKGEAERLLMGRTPLVPGHATQLAFSIRGDRSPASTARLFVGGRPEAERADLRRLRVSGAPVRLGSDAKGLHPFRGTLRAPRFFSTALGAEDLAGDGTP